MAESCPCDVMQQQLTVDSWFLTACGTVAYDTCWIYKYKPDWSTTPYHQEFSCPCGCCGTAWDRQCCPSEPVCHHNSTVINPNSSDHQEDADNGAT